jgi:hypothetical protein
MIDDEGLIWVFVSGRGRKRPGFKFKSKKPFDISEFEQISMETFTYPQPWNTECGYLHLFTKYTGMRQLYFETSTDGEHWTDDRLLAAIPEKEGEKSGHYQISCCYKNKLVGTFFNRHINGDCDTRTDLYYVQTEDLGKSWIDVEGNKLELPLNKRETSARAIDYQSQQKNVYLKDMGFDSKGNPVCLYIRSSGYKPGPESGPYEWCITKWEDRRWQTKVVTTSNHNYDMGSIFIEGNVWKIVGPTEDGPQKHGEGGELAVWESTDSGNSWEMVRQLTENSELNHGYVRRPLDYKAPFCFFWADGNPHQFSPSHLYFGDFDGNIWKLPYKMTEEFMKLEKLK